MSEVRAYDIFKLYQALKLHFSTASYDYFKYHGKVNISEEKFLTRRDKYFFYRAAKKYSIEDFKELLVANFVQDSKKWIGDILREDGELVHLNHKKKIQSLSYIFGSDVSKILANGKLDDLIKIKDDDSHPKLLNMVIGKEIEIETLIILKKIADFFPYWDAKLAQDIMWPDIKRRCDKYEPFLNLDIPALKAVLKKKVVDFT